MNFKISVILLHLFTTTLPISHHSSSSLSALASNFDSNDTAFQSQIRKIQSITTTATISTKTCTDRYCYNMKNETVKTDHRPSSVSHSLTSAKNPIDILQNIFATNPNYDRLTSSSILYGVLKIASKRDPINTCYKELNQMYDGIHKKEIWTIKALDSSGRPEAGFVLGHNFWLGSMQGCEAVRKPHTLTISNRFQRFMHSDLLKSAAPFDIDYRMVYAEHRSPWQIQVEFVLDKVKILHIGLCLPTSCSNGEIANLTQDYFDMKLLDAQLLNDYHPNVLEVKDLHATTNFLEKKSVRLLGICVLFTVLMMITAYLREENSEIISNVTNTIPIGTDSQITAASPKITFTEESLINPPDVILDCKKTQMPTQTFFVELIQCFSVRDNWQKLFSTQKPSNAVPIIDGLKSVGCFLILLFHMSWYIHYTVHNTAMMFAYGEQALWQWVSTTPIIVDVFFTISGLLLSYNFLRNQSRIDQIKANTFWQNVKLFGKQLLHRYLRLTPLYLIVVGLMEISTAYMVETTPFWIHDRYDITCDKYWWRNVFYIQNLFHVDDLCVSWSWSLACEMQFFILFSAVLFLYAKYPNAAKAVFCSLFGIFSALVFTVAIFTQFTPAYDVMHSLGNDLYVSPWTRVLPYLIGVGAGYIMYTANGVMSFQESTVKFLWTLATTLAILSHISTINRDISYVVAAPLITAVRIFYSASIAWMIVASQMGHGGIFAKIFNYPVFVHVNKLSYAIYLLNPAIISVIYGSKDHSTHVDPITMIVMSVGVMVIVYLASIVFSIMFEIPYTNLSGKLLKRAAKTKTVTEPSKIKKSL